MREVGVPGHTSKLFGCEGGFESFVEKEATPHVEMQAPVPPSPDTWQRSALGRTRAPYEEGRVGRQKAAGFPASKGL